MDVFRNLRTASWWEEHADRIGRASVGGGEGLASGPWDP